MTGFRVSTLCFAASLAGLAALTGACKKLEYPACKKDKHCKVDAGEKCVDGTCQNCTTNDDCKGKGPSGVDWVCSEFRCTDPAAVGGSGGPPGVGAPCAGATDCQGGLVCTEGKCAQCTEDLQCSPGTCDLATGTCGGGGGAAGGQCTTDDQCKMDEICDNGSCVFSGVTPGAGPNPCSLDAVFFEFDSPDLKPETQQQLQGAAECIKQQNRQVFLEAHADQRGTEEYNIMLTERRGAAVKKFLGDLGVPADKLQVVSKGSLEATGSDEASMAKDRRVQFIWP
jgi:peptidoglycan-associated lipoprotein